MRQLEVGRSQWHETVVAQLAEHPWLAQITAVDGAGERGQDPGIIVLCRLEDHDGDAVVVVTRVPRDGGTLDSLADVLAGAGWYEREIHDFFGVGFGDDRPLLVHDAPRPPLRKEVILTPRAVTSWPGARDPSDTRGASRRRALPAGVPDPETWARLAAGEDLPDTEVVESLSGRRMNSTPGRHMNRTSGRRMGSASGRRIGGPSGRPSHDRPGGVG